jgi:MFS family permease
MRSRIYKHYLLVVLLVILAFNYVDRLALGLMLQDIKLDLGLSDTQLGFLTGLAFALFYSLMGLPIARWADRGNRVAIISVTTALWSAAVALCGLAGSFVQLLMIRVGVAVGEAGCIPPAHSLIADYFTRAERPRAVSIYILGGPLAMVIGYFVAGWLNEFYGWRATFAMLGLPGLALTVLAALTLKEPRRGKHAVRTDATAPAAGASPGMREVCVTLWANITFRHLLLAFAVGHFFGYGVQQWQPAFFMRSYGLQTGQLGTWFALINGVGGLLGTFCGGAWATRHAANNERLQLRAMAAAYSVFGVLSAFTYLAPNYYVAFGLMSLATFACAAAAGPMLATIQTLVPQHMRATSIAMIYLFANLIGMGLGPLAAGILSDSLHPFFGDEALRYSLLALCPGYLWVGWHLLRGSHTVTHDLEATFAARERRSHEESIVTNIAAET